MSNELLSGSVVNQEMSGVYKPGEIFMSIKAFEDAQRMVAPLAKSDLVPATFQGKVGNCLIALEMAQRIGASPLMVMQNLYIVYGKPAWSSQFLIACINASGKFSPLRYKMTGEKGSDSFGCIAWAVDNAGERLESPEVTIGIAKKEGWFNKNGSKWQSMPELMLRYRCATLFARLFAPELTMGIQTDDEVVDVQPIVTDARPSKFETTVSAVSAVSAAAVECHPESMPEEKSDAERIAEAIAAIPNYPVSFQQVMGYIESAGEIPMADMVIPNLNHIAEAILQGGD